MPFHYSTSVGVNKDNQALMTQINRVLKDKAKDIQALLKAEGMPLLPLNEKPKK